MILDIRNNIREWKRPLVMGILNLTPDSFYADSRVAPPWIAGRAEKMLEDGCDILDLGGMSSRPGAEEVSEEEELCRLLPAVRMIREKFGDEPLISVDTYRASVAEACVKEGADIINDISGGDMDPAMFETVARLKVPYVLMHMRGMPKDMQSHTDYDDVCAEVLRDLAFKADKLHRLGVADVILDPGFGFAKTLEQNYRLLGQLRAFKATELPVLVGMSRKSMICKALGVSPYEALNGTSVLNTIALMNGADILRVHDVKEAMEAVKLFEIYRQCQPESIRTISVTDAAQGQLPPQTY